MRKPEEAGTAGPPEPGGQARRPGAYWARIEESDNRAATMRSVRSAFTLIELLVVISIIGILMTLMIPLVSTARHTAFTTSCANNLKRVIEVSLLYAGDNNEKLPPCNADNPATFHLSNTVDRLVRYMQASGLNPTIWYCPALEKQDPVNRARSNWNNWRTSQQSYGEFRIGYFYVGNPVGATNKFQPFGAGQVRRYPVRVRDMEFQEDLVFDICSAARPVTTLGKDVRAWATFPHNGVLAPKKMNVGRGDGSVQARRPEETTNSYHYIAAVDAFW